MPQDKFMVLQVVTVTLSQILIKQKGWNFKRFQPFCLTVVSVLFLSVLISVVTINLHGIIYK